MNESKTISVEGLRKRLQRANRKKGIIMSVGRPPKSQTFDCEQSKDDDGVYKCKEVTKEIKALKPVKAPKMGKTSKKDFVKPARRKPPKHKSINNELEEQAQQFNQTQRAKEEAYSLQLEKLRGEGQDRELAEMNRQIDRQNTALGFQGVASKFAEQERTINDLDELARQYLPRNTDNRGHRIPKRTADNIGLTINETTPQVESRPTLDDLQPSTETDDDDRFNRLMSESADVLSKSTDMLSDDEPQSSQKNIDEPVVEETPFQPKNRFIGSPIIEEAEDTDTDDEPQKAETVDTDDEEDDIQADLPKLDESPLMFIESVPPKADALFYLPKQLKELTAEDKKELFKSLGVKSDKAYTALRKERQKV